MRSFHKFHEGAAERARSDLSFRRSLLREGTEAILNGEFEIGCRLIRDYTQSVDFLDSIANELGIEEEDVVRLFDPEVNVGGAQLLSVLTEILRREGLSVATRRDLGLRPPRS